MPTWSRGASVARGALPLGGLITAVILAQAGIHLYQWHQCMDYRAKPDNDGCEGGGFFYYLTPAWAGSGGVARGALNRACNVYCKYNAIYNNQPKGVPPQM